jgi:hypothetical protein
MHGWGVLQRHRESYDDADFGAALVEQVGPPGSMNANGKFFIGDRVDACGRAEQGSPQLDPKRDVVLASSPFSVMTAGLVTVLISQIVGSRNWQAIVGIVLCVLGQLVITVMAFVGSRQVVTSTGSRWSAYHRRWTQLSSGLAIPEALLALRRWAGR